MIDYLRGTLTYKDPEALVVETGGIGYRVHTGNPFRFGQSEGEEITVYTYQYVREDTLALYGFISRDERSLFEKLLQVSGIGPKVAMAILASGEASAEVIGAIQTENIAFLTQFPGIGKKTAQRIIIELKDKLDDLKKVGWENPAADPANDGTDSRQTEQGAQSVFLQEAFAALQALGYAEKEVRHIIPQIEAQAESNWDTEQYVKMGLQLLLK